MAPLRVFYRPLSKCHHNLAHYVSCHAVRCTAYLNFCSGRVLKGLGHGTYSFRIEGPGLALAWKFEALALRFWP